MTRAFVGRLARKVALVSGVAIVGILLAGVSFEGLMRFSASRRYPAPGRMVDIGGRRIQIDCRGAGSPTVALESGLDNYGSLSWAAVHDSIAKTTRVCAYSRAGIMWSDRSDVPFDARQVAHDLHAALEAAGERAPWVLVGHSIGGPYITVFTDLYPSEVAGLVFVDPSHPDQFARYNAIVGRRTEPNPRIFAIGDALAWTGLVRLVPNPAPPSNWPRVVTLAPRAYLPRTVRAMLNESRAVDQTLADAGRHRQFGDRPEVVLTAMAPKSSAELEANGITAAQGAAMQAASRELHDAESSWSSRGRHELVPDASHYIQLDRPDVVIGAVREVVGEVRRSPSRPHLAWSQR
jgi:pimeloyl-ACP methyl ester carboxylesterase